MRRRRGRAGIVCPVTNAWGGCLPGGRLPCESRRRKGVLTGVALTKRGVVLGELIVEENQKEGLSLESTNSTKRV